MSQHQASLLLENKSTDRTLLFLGTLHEKAYFAFDVEEATANKYTTEDPTREFTDLRFAAPTLRYDDAAILAQVYVSSGSFMPVLTGEITAGSCVL